MVIYKQKSFLYSHTLYQKRNESKLFLRLKVSSFSWCMSFIIGDISSLVTSSFMSIFELVRTLRTWTACWLPWSDFQIVHESWTMTRFTCKKLNDLSENHPRPLSFLLHCETMYRSRLDFRCFITSNHTVWSSPNAIFSAVFWIQCFWYSFARRIPILNQKIR